jgi:CRP/FNR family transcriptional regulator, cyclic AMP receptor protein
MSARDPYQRLMLLKGAPTFSSVALADLRIVAQELEEDTCYAGELVFEEGDPSDRMYLVASGKVGISMGNGAPKEFVHVLGAGECFGEMGLFDDQPRSATAVAIDETLLLALDKHRLRGLMASFPGLARGLLRGLSLRLRRTNELLLKTPPDTRP